MTKSSEIGVYICSGCEIGDCINTDKLVSTIEQEFPVNCNSDDFLCSAAGIEIIRNDINKNNFKGIVIGACSPRLNHDKFTFPDSVITERVNLRELVSWSHEADNEDTQMMAEDQMRMGLTKSIKSQLPLVYQSEKFCSDILVVGGGVAGLNSALQGAKAGYKVILIEKENELGGWAAKITRQIPYDKSFDEPIEPIVGKLIDEIKHQPLITIFLSTTVAKIDGEPGNFNVILEQENKKKLLNIGAIVLASGWKPYDANRLEEYGYGKSDRIISSVDLENHFSNNTEDQIFGNNDQKRVLFIQCAGSRDENHLAYCSNICCNTSLKQAHLIRQKYPESLIYILYKDIRSPGYTELFYKKIQEDGQIFLTKGKITEFKRTDNYIEVEIEDSFIADRILLEVDTVVLATGMQPSDSESLNLSYRLGKGLPDIKYHFPDSHFICFPYETRRTGIYAAGAVRAPMDISSSMEDAGGAMLKAIQCIECTKRGESVHPRSGDISYPELYLDRCTDCKRCTEECPFGAYDENEKGTPIPNTGRCRRCGLCLGACPERIINFKDFSIDIISSMIKSVHIPDEFEEKPRILVFLCENDAYPAFDIAGQNRLILNPFIRIIPVRCIGSINKAWISDALSRGFDGIMIIGCKPGDNYQCHYIHGSELAETRAENFRETLETMMLEPERLQIEFLEITDYLKVPDIVNNYLETIEEIGPNPFKEI